MLSQYNPFQLGVFSLRGTSGGLPPTKLCWSNVFGQPRQQQQQQQQHHPPALLLRPAAPLPFAASPASSSSSPPRPRLASVLLPADLVALMGDDGVRRANEPTSDLLFKAIFAGAFIGCGGMLCSSIGGDVGLPPGNEFWTAGKGLQRFVFGAVGFPLAIILTTITGSSAFTANVALAGAAVSQRKIRFRGTLKMLSTTYVGCLLGCMCVGLLACVADLPCVSPSQSIAFHKLDLKWKQTLARGIGGGWLIAMAMTMANAVIGGGGNFTDVVLAIFFPVSTYVMLDFEHCLANFYFFSVSLFSGALNWDRDAHRLVKNIVFSTLGNCIGAGIVAGGLLNRSMALLDKSKKRSI